jgi:transcriptional regulator with XRE-family HTH domain
MRKTATDLSGLPLRLILAKNIRMARIDRGMSQEALAAQAGLDRAFVGTMERGARNISIDNVERLAEAVGLPAHDLLNPRLATERGYDPTLNRAPRTVRPYAVERRNSAAGAKRKTQR